MSRTQGRRSGRRLAHRIATAVGRRQGPTLSGTVTRLLAIATPNPARQRQSSGRRSCAGTTAGPGRFTPDRDPSDLVSIAVAAWRGTIGRLAAQPVHRLPGREACPCGGGAGDGVSVRLDAAYVPGRLAAFHVERPAGRSPSGDGSERAFVGAGQHGGRQGPVARSVDPPRCVAVRLGQGQRIANLPSAYFRRTCSAFHVERSSWISAAGRDLASPQTFGAPGRQGRPDLSVSASNCPAIRRLQVDPPDHHGAFLG